MARHKNGSPGEPAHPLPFGRDWGAYRRDPIIREIAADRLGMKIETFRGLTIISFLLVGLSGSTDWQRVAAVMALLMTHSLLRSLDWRFGAIKSGQRPDLGDLAFNREIDLKDQTKMLPVFWALALLGGTLAAGFWTS